MNVIERINMLKKIVKEAERIVAWQADIYTTLHNIDAGWVVSGVFPVARGGTGLSTIALGGILYASALDVLSRLAPTAANQILRATAANALQFAALLAADIPNLPASKITSGQFPLSRLPRAASGLFLEGNGAGADPIFNALVAGDIPNLDAGKITTGTFPVGRGGTGLLTIALGGILYASALDTLSRLAPTAANQVLRSTAANALQFAALLAADIPALAASKITSGQFPLARLPRAASGQFLEGNGVGADPIYNALIAANIPNLPTSKITSGRFPMTRMPDMALDKVMVGQGAGNSPVAEDKYTNVNVLAVIAAKLKAGSVTDTTGADGKISVTFAEAFASTPVVIIQLEGDVDYYPVITAKSTTGFTVKVLRTYHNHTQGSTGGEAAHTHGISFTSGAGSSHRHSNPYTGYESSHTHTQGVTGLPSTTHNASDLSGTVTYKYVALTSGGSPTYGAWVIDSVYTASFAKGDHTHTNPTTSGGSSHRHSVGYSGYESAHTHSVSGTSGAGSSHSHSNPDTAEVNAGNLLATTEVTFSYIAMLP